MRATGRRMFGELVAGLGAIVAAMFAVTVLVWTDIDRMQVADAADTEAREELAQDAVVIEAMADQDAALRRFLVSGEPQFLRSYEIGRQRFEAAMPRFTALTADDSLELQRAAADVAHQARRWTDAVATPAIAAALAGHPDRHAARAGQPQIDAIRADIAMLRHGETRLLVERDTLQVRTFQASRITLVVGSALALVFGLLIGGRSLGRLIADRRAAQADAARLADALERAHAAERAKTLFLSNMSHEMRTPLNGVSGMAEALGRTRLDSGQRELLGMIAASAASLDRLIGDLLSLSRGDRTEGQQDQAAFHLGDAVRAIAADHQAHAALKGLGLHAAVAPEAETLVLGDPARLRQLLGCLLSNAVKFTDRGRIRLTLESLSPDRYRFAVADTGIGFDETRKAQLFETFSQSDDSATRRHGGAGLGLALAQQLAVDLGGRLDCRSQPGAGSVFTFDIDLPTADPDAGHGRPATDAAAAPPDDQPLRILVVDDNATNRKVLELILEGLGVESHSVEDGQQAVEAVRQQAFAAILMDIQMPVMDGLTATREIRRLERDAGRPATPVIIVSANGQPEHIQAGSAAGAQLHLTKPVNAQALVGALNAVLAEPDNEDLAQSA